YVSTDAVLEFTHASRKVGGLRARLSEVIAFLVQKDQVTGETVLRQLHFMPCEENMNLKQDTKTLENALKDLTINSGDSLLIVVKLNALGEESLPLALESYEAELRLVPTIES